MNNGLRSSAWLALGAALAAGCSHATGAPYNAALTPQLVAGTSTTLDARKLLGQPLGAWPYRAPPSPANACPTGEQWRYQYSDKKNACSTILTFDDSGKLCTQTSSPPTPLGSKCTTNP